MSLSFIFTISPGSLFHCLTLWPPRTHIDALKGHTYCTICDVISFSVRRCFWQLSAREEGNLAKYAQMRPIGWIELEFHANNLWTLRYVICTLKKRFFGGNLGVKGLIDHGIKLFACWLELEWGLRNNTELPSLEVWEIGVKYKSLSWQHDGT